MPTILTVSPPQTIMTMTANAPPFVMTARVLKVWAGVVFVHHMAVSSIGLDRLYMRGDKMPHFRPLNRQIFGIKWIDTHQ